MFHHLSTNQSQNSPNNNFTPAEAIGILALVGAALGSQMMPKLEGWYFRHYEQVYLSLYGTFAILIIVAIHHITKRTKKLASRVALLNEARRGRGAIFVGRTDDGANLYLSEERRTGHVQIVAATGRGKTESVIVPWLCRDMLAGRDVILIDGKGDPGIMAQIELAAHRKGNELKIGVFDLGNPEKSVKTNPLARGSAQQITDRIFAAFTFEDPYYKAVQYDVTSAAVRLLLEVPIEIEEGRTIPGVVTFARLYEGLTNDATLIKWMGQSQDHSLKRRLGEYLALSRSERQKQLSGLLSQIAPFAIGEVAPLVNALEPDWKEAWTISDIVLEESSPNERFQLLFVLLIPTLKYQQLGHQLGKLLLQELGWAVGARASKMGSRAPFVPVYLDEFAAFVYDGFSNILNKARSSRVALHMSHQSLGDLDMVSPAFGEVVTTNSNVKCILGLNDPESADFMARQMGTETQEKLTEQAEDRGLFRAKERTGKSSIREVEAYKIHPNALKNYMYGRGVLHMPTGRGNLTEEIQFARLTEEELYGRH